MEYQELREFTIILVILVFIVLTLLLIGLSFVIHSTVKSHLKRKARKKAEEERRAEMLSRKSVEFEILNDEVDRGFQMETPYNRMASLRTSNVNFGYRNSRGSVLSNIGGGFDHGGLGFFQDYITRIRKEMDKVKGLKTLDFRRADSKMLVRSSLGNIKNRGQEISRIAVEMQRFGAEVGRVGTKIRTIEEEIGRIGGEFERLIEENKAQIDE